MLGHGSPPSDIHVLDQKMGGMHIIGGAAKLRQQHRHNYSEGLLEWPRYGTTSSVTVPYTSTLEDITSGSISTRSSPLIAPLKTAENIPIISNTPGISTVSRTSSRATEATQRKIAREVFEQHGIRRPSGWFSDEDLSLSGDRTASPRRFCRICHVCSARTWSQTHCSSCKHHLCEKCLCEVPKSTEKRHSDFVHRSDHAIELDKARPAHPAPSTSYSMRSIQEESRSPSIISNTQGLSTQLVEQSPSAVLEVTTEPTFATRTSGKPAAQQYPHCLGSSQRIDDPDYEACDAQAECDNPMCRATHDGHYPYRHSIACALHRSEEADEGVSRPLDETVHRHYPASFHDYHIIERVTSTVSHGSHRIHAGYEGNPITETRTSALSYRPPEELRAQCSGHFGHLISVDPLTRVDPSHYTQEVAPPDYSQYDKHCPPSRDIIHSRAEVSRGAHQFGDKSNVGTPSRGIRPAKSNENFIHEESEKRHSHHKHSRRGYSIPGQSRKSATGLNHNSRNSRRHDNSYDTMVNVSLSRGRTVDKEPSPSITKGIANDPRTKGPVPKGYLLSPPPWLKRPSKEAGDARSILRPVGCENHRHTPKHHTTSPKGKEVERTEIPPQNTGFLRESFGKLTNSSHDLLRISAPSPQTALHVTQHQRPES
ncbi:uncharacterized protein F4822DRAFT_424346 [Hypoxylon trugodes]|uniref:uncharacterized protein n=1 Tax=Hypoxylon trugodes TaxID=326681 RepID=UPI00219D2F5A|nr:uncharacterized protein F4822DRAFT_424346 [Hypoxylon trugodes]KAI1393882.1 hypothetical protein F4822DRAFT_424346 [Hypoxylon trugodes]